MLKSLDPAADAQFNQLHPRAKAGTMGLRPGQFAPKSEAEKLAEEAEKEAEQQPELADEDTTTVQAGTSEQDARVAATESHAKNLRKSAEEVEPVAGPDLIVVFGDRADATKFALAVDAVQENAAHTAVRAAANGKYHVEPTGMSAVEIDRLQQAVHQGVGLADLMPPTPEMEKDVEPMDEALEAEPMVKPGDTVDPAVTDNSAIMCGIEEGGREYLQDAVRTGRVSEATLDEVLEIARAIQSLSESRENGFLPVAEALHYGSRAGLAAQMESGDLETAARARIILDQMGNHLTKGASMAKPMLLVPVKAEHTPSDNDGKARPVGTDEKVAAKVGTDEDITERTARYPKTGHKQKRRPRLILRGTSAKNTLAVDNEHIAVTKP